MTQIALASTGLAADELFTEAVGTAYLSLPMPTADQLDDFYGWFGQAPPGVMVLDATQDPDLSLTIATHLTAAHPHAVVLLLAEQVESLGLAALRAGVSDLISATADADAVQHTLNEAVQRAKSLAPSAPLTTAESPSGRVISVVSAKGGVGKTTVATNLAILLAEARPYSTVLVDLDLQFGDVANTLGLEPEYRMEDVLHMVAHGDTIALKSRLTLHDSGLLVLPGPDNPAVADTISNNQISQLLEALQQEFPYVVVDTETGLSDHTLGALDYTTDPLLLTSLSVPSIHGLRKVIDTLSLLQMFDDDSHVLINGANTKDGVTSDDAIETLGLPAVSIPVSKRAPAATNTGVPLAQSRPRDPLVKALRPVVDALLPDDAELPGGLHRQGRRKAVQ